MKKSRLKKSRLKVAFSNFRTRKAEIPETETPSSAFYKTQKNEPWHSLSHRPLCTRHLACTRLPFFPHYFLVFDTFCVSSTCNFLFFLRPFLYLPRVFSSRFMVVSAGSHLQYSRSLGLIVIKFLALANAGKR